MKIIILDMLINQYENREVATASIRRIDKELRTLSTIVDEGREAVLNYFVKGNDGKPFHGLKNGKPIYKYDLTDGDRILYVHGSSLPYLDEADRDSYVLLSYATHDVQERVAKSGSFFNKHAYYDIKDYVQLVDSESELTEEECESIASLIYGNFKAYVVDENELSTLTAFDLDTRVLLTPQQKDYLEEWQKKPAPTLITGGAGTGKTVISLRLLEAFDESNENSFAAYFTQSKELLKAGKKRLSSLLKSDYSIDSDSIETNNKKNVIDFYNINDYCLNALNLLNGDFVQFKEFEEQFFNQSEEVQQISKKANLSCFDVWTDIRGVIKGSMDENWMRRNSISQFDFRHISSLVEKGILYRLKDNPQRVKLSYSPRECRKRFLDCSGNAYENKELLEIIQKFETVDTGLHINSLEDYLSVPSEISLFDEKQKRYVYRICELYQKWLEKENKYDENDIVLGVLGQGTLDSYDLIVVDEVQDYTELQLYLIYCLCNNKNSLVFAGDIHQVINPTVFSHQRLKKLFLSESGEDSALRIRTLDSNYRCQQGIVDSANKLSELRRKKIGLKKSEFEKMEEAHDPTVISHPFRLNYTEKNIKLLLEEVMKYPRVGVLVADEGERQKLVSIIGKEQYEEQPCIFTPSEIKGVEYQYVVCVNLFTRYYGEWNTIINSSASLKRDTKNRFYFNLIYVALTRAQLHICFIDKRPIQSIDSVMELGSIDSFESEKCHFSDLSNSLWDWYEMAKELHENGLYDKALKYYYKSCECASEQELYECRVGAAESKKDYGSLIKLALSHGDLSLAKRYVGEKGVPTKLRKMVEWFDSPTLKSGVADLIKRSFEGASPEQLLDLYSAVISKLRKEAMEMSELSILAKGVFDYGK